MKSYSATIYYCHPVEPAGIRTPQDLDRYTRCTSLILKTTANIQPEGLQVGDVLLRFGDHEPRETATFRKVVADTESRVNVVVERAGNSEPLSIELTLDGPPPGWGYATAEDPAEPGCPLVTKPQSTADWVVGSDPTGRTA